jgi:DNA ligase-1
MSTKKINKLDNSTDLQIFNITNKLYFKSSTGKINTWDIMVKTDNKISYIYTYTGQVGGKIKEYIKKIEKGKNIGKKNETTHLEQALFEAKSQWQKKIDKNGYRENIDELENANIMMPMCAQYFDQREKYIDFKNAYVQPKLDGVRCILNKKKNIIKLYSKNGLEFFNLDHIKMDIQIFFSSMTEDIILDGELYTDKFPFNKINGYVRRTKGPETLTNQDWTEIKKINFHIFDCFSLNNKNWIFKDRYNYLKKYFEKYNNIYEKNNALDLQNLKFVFTKKINCKDDVYSINLKFIKDGYEGIIIRNGDGLYKNSKSRSNDLQKYKLFQDDEFKIIGFEEGVGQDEGTVIWICNVINGNFRVRPIGTVEERRNYFKNGDNYIGKMLTVRFQEYSEDGIPRFPVGLRIREIDYTTPGIK